MFMKRAENHRNMLILQTQRKVCHHIQISTINFIEVSPRQNPFSYIAGQDIRAIALKIVSTIHARLFRYDRKIRHVHR